MNESAPEIRYASRADLEYLKRDRHLRPEAMATKVERREVLLAFLDAASVGWLRFGLFWDEIPFMSMLFVDEGFRHRDIGRTLVGYWEAEMKRLGFARVMTSTQANEQGQFFYRKLGYVDTGALLLPGDPLEIVLRKEI